MKLKIAIVTVNQIYSNLLNKALINEFDKEIVLIADSGVLLQNRSLWQSVIRYIKISGFNYVFVQAFKLRLYRLLSLIYEIFGNNINNKFYSYHKFAARKQIKTLIVEDVNSKHFVNLLKRKKVNLIVSVLFNQILKAEIIRSSSKGVINIHPAFLPKYRGTGPIFWSLVNKEKYVGISVHMIDEGIDTGGIIQRTKIKVLPKDTEDTLYWKAVKKGAPMLIKAIRNIEKGKIKTIPNKKGEIYFLPKKSAVKKYLRQRKQFFRLSDYIFNN